ncbi:MAG: DUF4956 domain-containing protein [Lachnospiraceae bacterium]
MDKILNSVIGATGINFTSFLLCFVTALILGLCIALVHMYRTKCSQSYVITLSLLPVMVTIIILMVNGNIGTGIAVAGAFSLTRFRSQPGTAKEIGSIFFAMVIGLCCGTGYIGVAILFTVVVSLLSILYLTMGLGTPAENVKTLTIVIPENLDYTEIFDDLFSEYTKNAELCKVRTTNMGSMYKLKYEIVLKNTDKQKEFLDAIRERNGNLEVMLGRPEVDENAI